MKVILFSLFLSLFSFMCMAQNDKSLELTFGDASVLGPIKQKTSKIYDNSEKLLFFLSNQQLRHESTHGIDITAHIYKGKINRLIAIAGTDQGRLATEWYFSNDQLIYAFESFEFYLEKADKSGWKNFKGLQATESRFYFVDEVVKFQRHRGLDMSDQTSRARIVMDDGNRILNFVLGQK